MHNLGVTNLAESPTSTGGDDAATPGSSPAAPRDLSSPYWLRVALSVLPLPSAVAITLGLGVNDPDTFWHLAAGQWLPGTWQFVGPEPWSAASTSSWIFHEWVPQLVLARAYQAAGYAGVSLAFGLGVGLVVLTVWFACRRRTFTLLTGTLVTLAVIGMGASLTPRPHLVSFAMAALFTGAWMSSARDGKARWWLVPAMWVWACSHGMWVVGVAISGLALVGILLDRSQPGRVKRLAAVAGCTALVPLLTPVGPSLALAPFRVSESTHLIQEWEPPSITDLPLMAVLAMATLVVLAWARSRERASWTVILMLAVGVGLALLYARTVAIGAAVVAPVAAAVLQPLLPLRRDPLRRPEVVAALASVAAALVLVPVVAPNHFGQERWGPAAVSPALASLPADTVVCNDYGLGGWLLWTQPHLRPAIDGRVEVYSLDHVERYIEFVQGAPGWETFPARVGCQVALLAEDAPVVEDLTDDGWTTELNGDGYAVLRKP